MDPAPVPVSQLRGHPHYLRPVVGAAARASHPRVSSAPRMIRQQYECGHVHVFSVCSSNLSDWSKSPSFNNFGPNITLIFIPGSVSCPDLAKADEASFGVEISAEEEAGSQDTGKGESGEEPLASSFDCGMWPSRPTMRRSAAGRRGINTFRTPQLRQTSSVSGTLMYVHVPRNLE